MILSIIIKLIIKIFIIYYVSPRGGILIIRFNLKKIILNINIFGIVKLLQVYSI